MDIDSVLKGHGIGIGGSNIKSIQRGTTTISATNTGSVSISNVDLTKSIVIVHSKNTGYTSDQNCSVRATLSNPTTVTFNRDSSSGTLIVDWQVIEFQNVKSLQKGTTSIASGSSATVTIASVNTSKGVVFCSYSTSATQGAGYSMVGTNAELTNSTTLTLSTGQTALTHTFDWQVIEFL